MGLDMLAGVSLQSLCQYTVACPVGGRYAYCRPRTTWDDLQRRLSQREQQAQSEENTKSHGWQTVWWFSGAVDSHVRSGEGHIVGYIDTTRICPWEQTRRRRIFSDEPFGL
jgi:hypothetical protein